MGGRRGETGGEREGWRSSLNSVFPKLKSHSHCLPPTLSTHTQTHTQIHTHRYTLLTHLECVDTETHIQDKRKPFFGCIFISVRG